MLRTRTDLMRMALYTALGLFPNACGGRTDRDADATDRTNSVTGASASASATVEPTATQLPVAASSASQTVASPADTFPHSNPVGTTSPLPTQAVSAGVDGGPPVATSEPTASSTGDAGPPGSGCTSSTLDPVTGLAQCDNGVLHRPNSAQCQSSLPRNASADVAPPQGIADAGGECSKDADCTEFPHGFCAIPKDGQIPIPQCNYGCVTDDECGFGFACVCGEPVGHCVAATCKTDADCNSGMLCATWTNPNGVGCPMTTYLSCQTSGDSCATDADCPGGDFGSYCSGERGIRSCVTIPGLACGRPFLVEGHARLADWVTGVDWCGAEPSLIAAHLSPAERQLLGAGWTDIALMEHASIAAFARFTLQLLHVGAPSELVAASQQAMLDETAHARACFTLASGFLGHGVSAGKLPMENALDATTLPEMVRLVIREGCVGETVAALEAAEAWAYAELPEIQQVLAKIRVDELQHAELAWQFVRWALVTGGDAVREAAEQEFAAVAAESHAVAADAESFNTLPYGLVPARLRAQLRTAAVRDIVLPCGAAVLRAARSVRASGAVVHAELAI